VLRELHKRWKMIGLTIPLHEGRLRGRERMCQKIFIDRDYNSVSGAYFSVLQQLKIAAPYIKEHLSELRRDNIGHTEVWIMKEHRRVFTTWLMDKEIHTENMTMKMLASRPSSCVISWQSYDINGYTYYTKEKDKKSVTQNSDIRIEPIDPQGLKTTYYGYIQNIWYTCDCHVMMMVFLAIAIQAIKPVHVKVIITRLVYFFNIVS
jgi:hypothetical protein